MKPTEECIVLAGGMGTRLRSVVSNLPKPLAPVAGRPFLAWVLDRLDRQEIRHVILATGFLGEQVEKEIGTRWKGMAITYSREEEPLGTGGAVRLAVEKLNGNECHLLNGDTFVEYSMKELKNVVAIKDAAIGMVLAPVENVARYGSVELDGQRVTGFREKGKEGKGVINAGCYLLTQKAITNLPSTKAFSFEQEVLVSAARDSEIVAIKDATGFIDIGVPEDYARAQILFASE